MVMKSPKPDPAIGQAALANAELGREMAQVGREELAFQREQWAKMEPLYTQMINDSLKDAASNRERSDEAWNFYKTTFKPIEEKYAAEAMNYDSPEEIARRTGAAAGTVQTQIDSARQQGVREAARMGVSADRTASAVIDDTNFMGLAKAGAVNEERRNTKLTGMALRESAANLGRGQTAIGLSTLAAANQSQGVAQGAITNQNANRSAGISTALAPMTAAVGANNSTANIYNSIYQGRVNAANGQGQAVGAGIGAIATVAAAAI